MWQQGTVLDLSFPLRGSMIPADHGYALYAAISRHLPSIHGDATLGIHAIRGRLAGERRLELTAASHLEIRLPAARIPEMIQMAGQQLDIDGNSCLIGVPTVRPLAPKNTLISRLVVIRGFTEAETFLDAVNRQLDELEIAGDARLVARTAAQPVEGKSAGQSGQWIRRTLRIRDKTIVGFSVHVADLSPDESLRLQERGLGGRRRFGCGLFVPTPR